MSKPYDATSKFFMTLSHKDWLVLIGKSADLEVTELDSDVSTVTASVDKLLLVNGPDPRIEHIEVQAWRDTTVPKRTCRYGVIVHYVRDLPVNSTVILLDEGADGPELNGVYVALSTDGSPFLQYHYKVIRIWELPAEAFLDAGIGVLAFAPLGRILERELPGLMAQMEARVEQELDPSMHADFWAGTSILMGLRWDLNVIEEFLKGKANVEASVYAQMLVKKGQEQGEKRFLLHTIEKRFGSIDPRLQLLVDSLSNQTSIEAFLDRVLEATSVEELV